MHVPFLDLKAAYEELREPINAATLRVLESGWYITGKELESFEAEFGAYVQAGHAMGVGNGLDALILSLRAFEIGPGDEVILPSNTFIATWLAVSYVGATPVPVEPIDGFWNIDPNRIERAITARTRAIIPVHLYGQPCELASVIEIARRHQLRVIEDAAQAQGAAYRGRRIGAHSDAVCWSFYPGKNLGALGDGGAVTTDDASVAERIRLLRNYGSRVKYQHEVQGQNSRLDELQAAILREKLKHLDAWNERRRAVASTYLDGLKGIPSLKVPSVHKDASPVWHLFVVSHPQRDRMQAFLQERGISTLVHYPVPPHRSGAYAGMKLSDQQFPITASSSDELLSLPIGPHLSQAQVTHVIEAVKAYCNA